MLRPYRTRAPLKMPGFEARFSQNLAPVSREKPQNPYLAYISHLFSKPYLRLRMYENASIGQKLNDAFLSSKNRYICNPKQINSD
jgi:hypothetical protein